MFYNCSSLKQVQFNFINTEKVINMKEMLNGCKELKYLYLYNFNTSIVIDMDGMFNGCIK